MAFEFSNAAVKTTFTAGEDLSAKQYHFVKIDNGDGHVVAVSAATDRPIGVFRTHLPLVRLLRSPSSAALRLSAAVPPRSVSPVRFFFRYCRHACVRHNRFSGVQRWHVH
jgi:hypothetical protein